MDHQNHNKKLQVSPSYSLHKNHNSINAKEISRLLTTFNNINDSSLILETLLSEGNNMLNADDSIGIIFDENLSIVFKTGNTVLIEYVNRIPVSEYYHQEYVYQPIENSLSSVPSSTPKPDPPNYTHLILVTLRSKSRLLGTLGFFFTTEPVIADEAINYYLAILSGVGSLALNNSLLAQTAMTQAAEMGLFYETATALATQMNTPKMLEQTLSRALAILQCSAGILFISDEDSDKLHVAAKVGEFHGEQDMLIERSMSIAYDVIHHQQTRIRNIEYQHQLDYQNDPINSADLTSRKYPAQILASPMKWQEHFPGVMVFIAPNTRLPFSENDTKQAQLVTFQTSNALRVARLIESEREQRRMVEALQSAALSIGREIHLSEVLDQILSQVIHAFNCDAANIMVPDQDNCRVIRAQGYEAFNMKQENILNRTLMTNQHKNLRQLSAGKVLIVADVTADPDWVMIEGHHWCKAWAGVPIIYDHEILGFINLDSQKRNSFSNSSIQQLQAFAAHAAIAMHKARLYERLANEHERLKQIYEVGRQIGASLLADEILDHLINACLIVLDGVSGVVLFYDEQSREFNIGRDQTRNDHQIIFEMASVYDFALQIAETEEPAYDYVAYPNRSYWLLGFPLRSGGNLLGLILIWVPSDTAFEQAWLDALATLGQQAALALVKAEKHAEIQRRLSELTLLQHVSSAIARQLEFDAVLQELTDQLHNQLGFPTAQVYIREKDDLILKQASGPQPAMQKISIDSGLIGRVARTGKPVLENGIDSLPAVSSNIKTSSAKLCVPIWQNEKVIGVLNIESADQPSIGESDIDLLTMLANQVSIALQNAMLYQQIRETVDNLESRVQARTAVLESVALQAREAERAKAEFVADVSHELRTPLTNIGLYLDLLEIGPEERQGEYFETMRRETERLRILIEQLLSISRLDSEQVEIKPIPVDINSLIEMLVRDRKHMAQQRGLILNLDITEEPLFIEADPQYIVQVMTNLLTNAMNYTPQGGYITLTSESRSRNKIDGICFAIHDSGPGIDEKEQVIIFNRFFRGVTGKNSGVSGTGLGLAISKEIVEQHNGDITLISSAESGTTFIVWLPNKHVSLGM